MRKMLKFAYKSIIQILLINYWEFTLHYS